MDAACVGDGLARKSTHKIHISRHSVAGIMKTRWGRQDFDSLEWKPLELPRRRWLPHRSQSDTIRDNRVGNYDSRALAADRGVVSCGARARPRHIGELRPRAAAGSGKAAGG